jgi:hypothetical protein
MTWRRHLSLWRIALESSTDLNHFLSSEGSTRLINVPIRIIRKAHSDPDEFNLTPFIYFFLIHFTSLLVCVYILSQFVRVLLFSITFLGPPLWSSGQSSWLQIQRSGCDSRRYHISWEAVGLERGPLSLVTTTEELLERKSSGSGIERREYGCRDPSRWPRGNLYPQKLAVTSPTRGGHSVGIVRSRTQATEFSFYNILWMLSSKLYL